MSPDPALQTTCDIAFKCINHSHQTRQHTSLHGLKINRSTSTCKRSGWIGIHLFTSCYMEWLGTLPRMRHVIITSWLRRLCARVSAPQTVFACRHKETSRYDASTSAHTLVPSIFSTRNAYTYVRTEIENKTPNTHHRLNTAIRALHHFNWVKIAFNPPRSLSPENG